ncbi:heterokaryon incompatibility protein-domain-containing protein [Xylaria cf. heliscus]|nr:heterokaryon incompatibility protein-domain-containing protein [Xylaria cf. heliscus]
MMLRWHRVDCPWPQVQLRSKSIACLTCGASYSHQSVPPRSYHAVPSTTIEKRSCLNLSWPSSVKYSEECVLKPGGEDLSDALIDFLGTTPNNERSDGEQEEKSKRGFPSLPSDHHIRVLRLSPARQWDETLHGFLEVQDLNGRPYYEALSYTWMDGTGDTSLSRRLYVGPKWDVLPITESCSRALRRLRLERADRPIWVDSVCINQLCNVEKSHQIALMRTIYARSIRCVVDLGEPSSSSDAAIDYANNPGDDESLNEESRKLKDGVLSSLFHRTYFSRMWIIQEIVFASYVQVNCGSRSVDWRLLVDSTSKLTTLNWMQKFRGAIATGRPTSAYNGHSGLLQLLRDTVDSMSSDPRDKIFALVGLVRGLDLDGITADYDLTYVQVYTGLAAYFIRNHGLAELITMRGDEDINLPSWVPNWRTLRESDWTRFDIVSRKLRPSRNGILLTKAKSVLANSRKSVVSFSGQYERLCPITQTTNVLSEQPYRPEIHGQTGALIHAASCVFSFRGLTAERGSSTVYTKSVWNANERDMSQLAIITMKPVIKDTDIIAYFLGHKIYIHLRKVSPSIYRILGEAMVFLYELSEEPVVPHIPSLKDGGVSANSLDLFTDFVTFWCEKVSIASELWQIFIDPSGIRGIRATFAWEMDTPCIFYYRVSGLEEAHRSYLSLKDEFGKVEGVLRYWINSGGQPPISSAVRRLIECILYWQRPHSWESVDVSLLPIGEIVESHPVAWINAYIIRQRWLAIEKILAEYYEMERARVELPGKHLSVSDLPSIMSASAEKIVKIWTNLTINLVLRLNIIADATSLEPFSIDNGTQIQANEINRECEEFLDGIFTEILHDLSKKPGLQATGHDQPTASSPSTEWPETLDQTMDLLRQSSSEGCHVFSGFHHDNSLENATDAQCPICIDLQTRYNAVSWKEHWKMPKSRSDIKSAVKTLGVTIYGDRRRAALRREPNARRAAQALGSLLDLSIRALRQEDIVII